jgi:HPt (histidine-containing phosphotransfer) domain-containing protein
MKAADFPPDPKPVVGPPEDPPIRLALALRRVEGDLDLLEELVKTFQEDLPGRIERLRAAIERGDPQDAARSAHSLRGPLGILGAEQAQALAEHLETFGSGGRLDEAATLYRTFEREVARVSAFFSSSDWKRRLGRSE